MMKKVMKTLLALAMAFVCGGAWATTPVAIWTNFIGADADAGITKGDYTLKANGNSVATDGSSIKIDQNVGVKIDRSTALANTAGMTVVYKFRNLVVGGTDKTLATSSTNTSGNDQSGVKITTAGQTSGMWGTGDFNTSATQKTIESVNSGSIAFVYGPNVTGNTGTYLYLKNGTGAYTSIYSCGGLKGQSDTPAGMAIGGRRAANNSFPAATGLVIESVAVFDNALTAAELATFSLEKEMLYCLHLEGNADNSGTAGSAKISTTGTPTWVTDNGKFGAKCVKTNSGSYTIYDENGIATFDQGWTISYWVNSKDVPAWQDICAFRTGNMVWKHEPTGDSAFQFYGGVAGSSSLSDGWSLGAAADGISKQAWNHIAIVSGADKASFDVYVNGVKKQSRGAVSGTNVWGADGKAALTGFTIGLDGVPAGRKNNGLVDEVSIFNFAATPTQVGLLASQKPSAEACLDGRELASSLFANGEIDNTNPHLLIHLDASNEDSFEFEEEKVSKWKDLSSYARHATPAQAKANDTMVTNKATRETENGRAIVNMGATGSGIDLGYTRMTTIRTVFQVMSIEQNANAFFLGDHGNQVYPFHRGGSGQYAMNNAVFGNNRDSNVWCDGVAKRPTLDTPPTDCHIYTIELGADGSSNRLSQDREQNGRNGGRKISEMLVFDRVLTPSERVAIESYLAKKWNISPVVPPQLSRKVIAANFGADYTTIPATVDTQFPLVSLPGSAWTQTRTASNTSGISIDVIDPMTLEATGASATMKWASKNTYRENGGVEKSSALTNGYLDDGSHTWWGEGNVTGAMIGFENIPFSSYDVVVIGATDGGSRTFRAVAVTAGDAAVQKYTFADGVTKVGDSNWGESYYRVPEEGKNALVIKGLTGATLTIQGGSNATSSRGGIAAVMIIDAGEKVWTNGTGDGNWNTAGNWAMGRVPTAEDDVIIDTPATITLANDSTAKSIKIDDNVTFTGAIVDGKVNNVTIADGKTLTVNYTNTGTEGGIRNVIGGTLVKTGAANLRLANSNGSAVNGTTVRIEQGTIVVHNSNSDAVMTDPTFVIGENGRLTNYGWFTANGTLTLESDFDKVVLDNAGGNNSCFKGTTKIVKKGTGNIKLMSWKANASNQACAIDAAIEIQAGRLTFRPQGVGYTVNGSITGAGSVGVIAGSQNAHCVVIGDGNTGNKNTYSGGTYVESGTLKLGHKFALGGQYKAITVQEGAVLDVNGVVDHGLDATLNGGTIKNSGSGNNDSNVQFRTITLTKDSFIDIASNYGVLNGGYAATTMTLNGYTLTKSGNGGLTLCNVTSDAGTLKIVSGPVRAIQSDSNLSQMSLVIAGEDVNFSENRALTFKDVTIENSASLQAGQGSFTVNGTLKVDGSIAKATTIATTGTFDFSAATENSIASKITGNLTIMTGAKLIFPSDYVENTAITLTTGTLTATTGAAQVSTDGGETFTPATATYDTEAKTVKFVTALREYALTDADIAAIEEKNISLGGAGIVQTDSETDIAKSCTFTNVPDGYTVYGLGGKFIGVVKMNYEDEMEAKLNQAALHFDASRLNTFAAGQDNAVTGWDNLGSDTTRPIASLRGNNNTANVSPVLTASSTSIYLDFGDGGSHKDLGWQRLEGIKTVIQVIDLVHDGNKGFFLGDWNSGSGTYGFHRGDNAQYLNTQHCKADYVYDNGVSKDRGADCPTGMRVLSMGETGSDNICSDCFSHDRNQGTRNGGRKLCETVVFTTALSDSERVAIEDYLLRKWFNAKAVVNGVPKTSIQEALNAAEDGDYTTVHTLVEPTAQEIPEGWLAKNGSYVRIYAKIGTDGYATLDEAIAALNGGAGDIKVVVRATGDLASAPANAAYTLEYTKGMGAENARYYLPYASAGASVTLSSATEADVYYTKETVSGNATTINMNNAIVNFGDIFSIGQATYNLTGTTQVTAPRLILSQGAAGRTSNLSMSGSAKLTVTGNNCVDSNQSTIMFGHYNGPSTFTISESAQFIAENAWVLVGKTGNDHTINIQGGTFTTKGIKLAGNASQNNMLTISGGELRLGDAGMTKNGGAMTTTVSGNATITATAATMPLELPITVNDNVTLSISGATIKDVNVSNITLGENSVLDLTGCTALEGVNYGTLRDFSSVPTDKIRLPDGACYVVEPVVPAEYANGAAFTLTNVPEDVTVKAKIPGVEALSEMTREGTTLSHDDGIIRISGMATSFDDTFVYFSDDTGNPAADNVRGTLAYQVLSGANMQYDHNPVFVGYNTDGEGNKVATKNTGVKMKAHPYIQGLADSWWQGTRQLTLAVVGTMPTETKTIFIHMGHSYTDRTGLMIATGDKEDEVVIAWNSATTIHEITRLSVPNAATARHVYIVTKNDDPDANTTTFTVYLDGMKWKTLEVTPLFTITGGVQVGSDFGGYIRGADVWHAANGESGIVNAIRLYGRVISDAEIAQYSVEEEFPYHSPKGSSARTFEAGAANWVAAEGTPWSNLAKDATEAVSANSALDGSSIEATLSGAAEIAVNVAEAGVAYEALNVKGSGTASFSAGEGSGAIRITGVATIGNAITTKPGALDLSTALITLAGDGAITFDYSEFEPSNELATQVIPLTGDMEQADDKVLVTLPASHPNHTMVKAYNTSLKKYELTVTMTNKVLDITSKDNTTPTATVQVGEGEAQTVEIVNGQITAPVGSKVVVTYTPNTGYFADENGVVTIESVGATSTVTAPEMPTLVKGQASVIAYESEEDMEGTKTYYKTLAQAVDAYEDGNDLMLETDVVVTETFTFAKSVSLAPNNFTISSANADVPAVKVSAATTVILVGQGGVANTASGIAVDVAGDLISVYSAITGRVVLDWDPSKAVDDQPTVSVNPSTILVDGKPLVKEYNDTLYRVTLMSGETTFNGITMMGYAVVSIDEEEPAKPTDDEPTVIDDPEEKVAMEPGADVTVPTEMPVENIKVVYDGIDLAKEVVNEEGEVTRPKYVEVTINETTGAVELTTTDSAKPAATDIAMSTPTVESQDKVQFTITNPIPGLFYAVSSCDTPDGDFESATGDQATDGSAKTVSIPMTFTDGKKVKYYKVSVKATK